MPARDYWPTIEWREASPAAHGLAADLLQRADDEISASFPNVYSLLIVRHGYLVFERYYHGQSASGANNVKSITKSITSALVGIALDRGWLGGLDQSLPEFFPTYYGPDIDPRKRTITLRHLLTMTSGLSWAENTPISREWGRSGDEIAFTLALPLNRESGQTGVYSSADTQLISGILTAVTGRSVAHLADDYLFAPLGIPAPYWPTAPSGLTRAYSDAHLTPRQLAKVGYLYLNRGYWDGAQIVPSPWVEASTRQQSTVDGSPYGYLWWIQEPAGQAAFTAWGYGGQGIVVITALDMVIVLTARSDVEPSALQQHGPIIADLIVPAALNGPGEAGRSHR